MPDFIPSPDSAFSEMLTQLAAYVAAGGGATLGLPTELISALQTGAGAFADHYRAAQEAAAAAQGATTVKNAARAECERLMRQANAFAQANPGVTDAQRAAAGLPVHKARRRSIGAPETHPVVSRVDNEHLLQRVWFADEAHPGSHARPAGVASCEIRLAVVPPGGPAPTDLAAMPGVGVATSTPFDHQFKAADAGSTAYYALRWLSPTGQPGPWSVLTPVIVT